MAALEAWGRRLLGLLWWSLRSELLQGSKLVLVSQCLSSPRIRSVSSALNNCNYYIGSILSSWVTFGTLQHFSDSSWSWRAPSLLQAAVPACILVPLIFMPHSPRWLISKGRDEQAKQVLARQHANGDLDDPLVAFEMMEITTALEQEHAIGQMRSPFSGWSDFIKTPGNRKRLWVIVHVGVGAQWNGAGIVSYYLIPVLKSVGITKATPQTLVNGGLAVSFPVRGTSLTSDKDIQPFLCGSWSYLG